MGAGGHHFGSRGLRIAEITGQHERDFSLRLGLQDILRMQHAAVVDLHIGEQHAEVWLIDSKLRLDRFRREAHLAPDDPAAACRPDVSVQGLHRIRPGTVARRKPVPQRRNRGRRVCRPQAIREHLMRCNRAHGLQFKLACQSVK